MSSDSEQEAFDCHVNYGEYECVLSRRVPAVGVAPERQEDDVDFYMMMMMVSVRNISCFGEKLF